ncbi:MAG: pirin family protein [Alphaproteobacteria bacterium]|nr:pirin family protein [Alphaproteobacteria bacterium]
MSTAQIVSPSIRRPVAILAGQPTSDGAGVKLIRVIGQQRLPDLDPFLMLDEFRSDDAKDYIAGFPDHPHRGFETVTYMLAGRMRHEDNKGNRGLLRPGSVQWMTAGRGIVHSELPEQEDGLMWGFQLWVNLPAKDKMTVPRYQEIAPEEIPETEIAGGGKVRVVAGRFGGVNGPISGVATDPTYLDVALPAGGVFTHDLPAAHNAFLYVFEGAAELGGEAIARGRIVVLSQGERVEVSAAKGGRFILVAGKPLGEPVAKYGPFVMNTVEELRRAVEDFQAGRF